MKRSHFNNSKAYHYFLLTFILFLGIISLYLSCKSKSPIEPTSSLHNQISTQSTNNTTTSSSTTTSVNPGQSPTNTTTLITSRNLTTTSTTTSSTSTTSTSTTTIRPTTTIPTTSVGVCNLQWCKVSISINNGEPITFKEYGGTYTLYPGDEVKISISIKNSGTANSINSNAMLVWFGIPPTSFNSPDYSEILGIIPANSKCNTWSNALQIDVSESASPGDTCTVEIRISSNNCSMISSTFGISIGK
jgi:hypothetical protein